MSAIAFRSPVRVPLLRFGVGKVFPPNPESHDTFRVTQRFDDPDSINPKVRHNAVDIGNFRCGDTLVAMASGVAYRVKDNAKTARLAPSDALGILIDHGQGVTSEIWHMSQWLVENGSPVNAGQAIGSVGSTGIGSVCHAHIEIKINGVRVDPEPYMFGEIMFPDVAANNPHKSDIEFMAERRFMVGDQDGNFNPTAPITRQEVASVLARILRATKHEDARR